MTTLEDCVDFLCDKDSVGAGACLTLCTRGRQLMDTRQLMRKVENQNSVISHCLFLP